MKRLLAVSLFLLACSSDSSESDKRDVPETRPAQPSIDENTQEIEPREKHPPTPIPQVSADDVPGQLFAQEEANPIVGGVQRVAKLKSEFVSLLHDVQVVGEYAYVLDAASKVYRVSTSGGEFEVVYDTHSAGFPSNIGGTIYFPTEDYTDERSELWKIEGGKAVAVTAAPDVLTMAGDEKRLFATVFNKNDIHKLGENGFELFTETHKPDSLVLSGDHLYWSSYQRGTIYRILLNGTKKTKLAKARKITGLAVVGDSIYFGTEVDGAIFALPTRGGKPKKILDGFVNTDRFVADDAGVYFSSWGHSGQSGAVLRLDAETHTIEALAYDLVAPRGLALAGDWLYVVGGANLIRVRTDTRMPWPRVLEK